MFDGVLENILGDELAELLKNWDQILVSGRDLIVLLEATILKDAVEGARLVGRLTRAVEQGEDFEGLNIDLFLSLTLLVVLKGSREQNLANRALRLSQG